MSELNLWSDSNLLPKNLSECEYNLHEDVLCLKERITELERELDRFREQTNEMNKGMLELNQRNEQLERERDTYKNFIETARSMFFDLDDMDVDSIEFSNLLRDLFLLFCGGKDFGELLVKRDIEQQINALEWLLSNRLTEVIIDLVGDVEVILPDIVEMRIEQLRKQQEVSDDI